MKEIKDIWPVAPGGWVVQFTDGTAWVARGEPETISQDQLFPHEETIWALCKRLSDLNGVEQ